MELKATSLHLWSVQLDLTPYVGDVIRALRAESGLSQEAAADTAAVDRSYWSAIERGANKNPSIGTLQKFAWVFGVGLDEVFNRACALAASKPPSRYRRASSSKKT